MPQENPFKISASSFSGGDLPGKYKHAWTEEALDVESDDAMPLATAHTREFLGTSIKRSKIFFFGVIIISILLIIAGRSAYLQIVRGTWYRTLAEGNRVRLKPITAERGIIFDRNNIPLVSNVPNFTLTVVPQDLPHDIVAFRNVIDRIATIANVTPDSIITLLQKYQTYSFESIIIKENLDYDSALKLYVDNADLPGVAIESGTRRSYAVTSASTTEKEKTLSFSHILGYVGKLSDDELVAFRPQGYFLTDSIGKTGLEKMYESELRGTAGKKKIEVNASGKEQSVLAVDPPVPGKNLILSVDAAAQHELERIIKTTAERTGKLKYAAVAMNPNTGEILAAVSWPAFDNNDFSGGISQKKYQAYLENENLPLFNRLIAGLYPPGSTIKTVVAAAALNEGIVTRATSFNSVGGMLVGGHMFKDWKAGGHGITNVTKAIAWSVNTYFYYVGGGYDRFTGLGLEKLLAYFNLFNLGQKTGIDIPGEKSGFLPSAEWKKRTKKENWYVGDTYNLSIGEGDVLVTPLQAAVWTAAVANGGTIVTPHFVHAIVDSQTKKVTVLQKPPIRKNVVPPGTLAIVRDGMRECVVYGSCKLLGTLPFLAAGKTGTAQWNTARPNHAWFTSFAPLDRPQIVVSVLVEEGGEGATYAMPVARDFLAWWGKKYLTVQN